MICLNKNERWHEELAKDVYVEEALAVVNDLTIKDVKALVKNNKKKKTKQIVGSH